LHSSVALAGITLPLSSGWLPVSSWSGGKAKMIAIAIAATATGIATSAILLPGTDFRAKYLVYE
jgi:hypothetical protein